jgi:hypothetical protein
MRSNRFSLRALVSFTILISFVVIVVSGLALYIKPQGKVASWQSWRVLGLTKGGWESLHTLTCVTFLIFVVLHIVLNWRSITSYLRNSVESGLNNLLEAGVALVIVLLVVLSSLLGLPPINYAMELGEFITASYAEGEGRKPPYEKAERSSLIEFCTAEGINPLAAVQRLRDAGMTIEDETQTLEEIANANDTTPMDVYLVIKEPAGAAD